MITFFLILAIIPLLSGCSKTTGSDEPVEEPKETVEVDVEEDTQGNLQEEEAILIEEAFAGAEYVAIDEGQLAKIKEEIGTLQSIEEARIAGELVGYKILVAPKGYGGAMEVFTYIDLEGKVLQVEIGEHGETTGVGDSVENPQFLSRFVNVTSSQEANAVDMISGATFSSGAVKDGVARALNVYNDYLK